MALTYIRRCTNTDKAAILAALAQAGIKARVRMFPTTTRICLHSGAETTSEARETVARVLTEAGYRYAGGQPFVARMFNQPHELFVAGAEA